MRARSSVELDLHGGRPAHREGLCDQGVFTFSDADSPRQRADGSEGGGVRVGADHGGAR